MAFLSCLRFLQSSTASPPKNSASPFVPVLPSPWILCYNSVGVQVFRDSSVKKDPYTYLNPFILAQLKAERKTGNELIVEMYAITGEKYKVDYGVPKGEVVWMEMVSSEERQKLSEEEYREYKAKREEMVRRECIRVAMLRGIGEDELRSEFQDAV